MTFDDMEETLFDMLDRLTELARITEENRYTLSEILKLIRHPKPEDLTEPLLKKNLNVKPRRKTWWRSCGTTLKPLDGRSGTLNPSSRTGLN